VGLLDPLYYLVSWILVTVHSMWSTFLDPASGWTWGLSIVILVVIMRIVLIPLFVKQIKAQRNMQLLSPQIKELQKRHKDDRERQSQEIMKLYRQSGTNPLSGCLPILLQAPFFFALFHVLQHVVAKNNPQYAMDDPALVEQAQRAKIFGAPIASTFLMSPDDVIGLGGDPTATKIVTVVMIILMSATTFLTQRQIMLKNIPNLDSNPFAQQQKILLYVFPVVFAVSGVNFPIGVLLYWLTTNLWTMGQQFYVIRNNPSPGTKAYEAWEARKKAKAAKKAEKTASAAAGGAVDASSAGDGKAQAEVPPPPRPAQRVQPKRQPRSKRSKPPAKR
jgi:YidC/Oxa1 family membrane protein insertase